MKRRATKSLFFILLFSIVKVVMATPPLQAINANTGDVMGYCIGIASSSPNCKDYDSIEYSGFGIVLNSSIQAYKPEPFWDQPADQYRYPFQNVIMSGVSADSTLSSIRSHAPSAGDNPILAKLYTQSLSLNNVSLQFDTFKWQGLRSYTDYPEGVYLGGYPKAGELILNSGRLALGSSETTKIHFMNIDPTPNPSQENAIRVSGNQNRITYPAIDRVTRPFVLDMQPNSVLELTNRAVINSQPYGHLEMASGSDLEIQGAVVDLGDQLSHINGGIINVRGLYDDSADPEDRGSKLQLHGLTTIEQGFIGLDSHATFRVQDLKARGANKWLVGFDSQIRAGDFAKNSSLLFENSQSEVRCSGCVNPTFPRLVEYKTITLDSSGVFLEGLNSDRIHQLYVNNNSHLELGITSNADLGLNNISWLQVKDSELNFGLSELAYNNPNGTVFKFYNATLGKNSIEPKSTLIYLSDFAAFIGFNEGPDANKHTTYVNRLSPMGASGINVKYSEPLWILNRAPGTSDSQVSKILDLKSLTFKLEAFQAGLTVDDYVAGGPGHDGMYEMLHLDWRAPGTRNPAIEDPSSNQNVSFQLGASMPQGLVASQVYQPTADGKIWVKLARQEGALTIDYIEARLTEGNTLQSTPTVVNAAGSTTYTKTSGPSWVTVDPSTGLATISPPSGTVAACSPSADPCSFPVTIQANRVGPYGNPPTSASSTFNAIVYSFAISPYISYTGYTGPAGKPLAIKPVTYGLNQPITFSVDSGNPLPAGLQINSQTGEIFGTPTETADGAFGDINIKAVDSQSTTLDSIHFEITPTLSYPTVTAELAKPITVVPQFSPPVAGQLTQFALTGTIPSGWTINPTSGVISGTVISLTSPIQLNVALTTGVTPMTVSTSVYIQPAGAPISVTYPTQSARPNANLTLAPTTEHLRGTATYSVINGQLPPGWSINSSSGVLTGPMPIQGGVYIAVQVTDGYTTGLGTANVDQEQIRPPTPPNPIPALGANGKMMLIFLMMLIGYLANTHQRRCGQ